MNANYTNIPLPQDTRLYQVANGVIQQPRLSTLSFTNNCTAGSYSDLQNLQLLFELASQNTTQINLSIYDKDVSSIGAYYSLDGYDQGFDHRFLNLTSPTVCFAPLIQATDLDTNVTLQSSSLGANYYIIINYTAVLSNTLIPSNYILLKTQTINDQNQIYRVISISGNSITIFNDSNINNILSQNQTYILTRAQINDSFGTSYYGLYNIGGYYWISQTNSIQLPTADYGITINADLTGNQISLSYFTTFNISPVINQVIAINVLNSGVGIFGGRTSGIYSITAISNGEVYFQPIFPAYVFFQQFLIVHNDFNYQVPAIWLVNPYTVTYNNYLYSSVDFNFIAYNVSPIVSNPALWAQQVGGINDTIIGFTLYTSLFNNNYISHSDIFSITTKVPSWVANNSVLEGLALNINYDTNILPFDEGVQIT